MRNFYFFPLAFPLAASAQTLPNSTDFRWNIDIIPLSDVCVKPGDLFSFEVVTRWAAGGNTTVALGNIDYVLDLGISTISFQGVAADGSFLSPLASTNGSVSGFMVDAADADNEFIPSTAGSDFGLLRADDSLDRIDPLNNSWESDWVFQIDWVVPLDAPLGTYAVTASEQLDLFTADEQFSDWATIRFPGSHTPFSLKVIPEPSSLLLGFLGMSVLLRRQRPFRA